MGDIAYTVSLVRPDVSLITNAGTAHVGEFGGPEKIVQAKGEILDGLSATGTAVLNRDDKAYPIWAERVAGKRIVSFGLDNPLADFSAGSIAYDQRGCPNFVLTGPLGNLRVQLNLLGRHNVANALAAAAPPTPWASPPKLSWPDCRACNPSRGVPWRRCSPMVCVSSTTATTPIPLRSAPRSTCLPVSPGAPFSSWGHG